MTTHHILVTGGSGCIGTHLFAAAVTAGHSVTNLDIKRPVLDAHAAHWVEADLMDVDVVMRVVAQSQPTLAYKP